MLATSILDTQRRSWGRGNVSG